MSEAKTGDKGKLVGPYADIIKQILGYYTSRLGKGKQAYPGQLTPDRPEEWDMQRAMLMKQMQSGGPDAWQRGKKKAAGYMNARRPTRRRSGF